MENQDKRKKRWRKIALSVLLALISGYWLTQAYDLLRHGLDESLMNTRGVARCAPVGLHRPRLLLRMGADPDYISPKWGWGLLHSAAHYGQVELVELLLANGADPDLEKRDRDAQHTPIWQACINNADSEIVDLVPRRKSFPSGQPLGIHSRSECPERRLAVIETLLEYGASPESIDVSCEFYPRFKGAAAQAYPGSGTQAH